MALINPIIERNLRRLGGDALKNYLEYISIRPLFKIGQKVHAHRYSPYWGYILSEHEGKVIKISDNLNKYTILRDNGDTFEVTEHFMINNKF